MLASLDGKIDGAFFGAPAAFVHKKISENGRKQTMEYATLQNGIKMPMEGFGVFQVRDKGGSASAPCWTPSAPATG